METLQAMKSRRSLIRTSESQNQELEAGGTLKVGVGRNDKNTESLGKEVKLRFLFFPTQPGVCMA